MPLTTGCLPAIGTAWLAGSMYSSLAAVKPFSFVSNFQSHAASSPPGLASLVEYAVFMTWEEEQVEDKRCFGRREKPNPSPIKLNAF